MIERYILVSDEEYVYSLDTLSKDYKTLEDFEKEEIKNAKKEGIDIDEYEEEILLKAHDKYWEWVYEYHIEADEVNDRLNNLSEENKQLKQRNKRQYNQLNKLWKLIETKDWKTLTEMDNQMKKDEEQLQSEWRFINED